jgi:hypothetical protein
MDGRAPNLVIAHHDDWTVDLIFNLWSGDRPIWWTWDRMMEMTDLVWKRKEKDIGKKNNNDSIHP